LTYDSSDRTFEEPFAGKSFPALISPNEPAIKLLKERYAETFAFTNGTRKNQVNLFLIKLGMWALVWTFTPKDLRLPGEYKEFKLDQALEIVEDAMTGVDEHMQSKLDQAVALALARVRSKAEQLKRN
jgi:hypothetical protein